MKLNKSDIYKIILSGMGLFIFFALLVNEIPQIFNVFKLPLVISVSSTIGLICAILFSLKVSKKAEELIEKFQIYVASIVFSIILFPLCINFINRLHTVEIQESFIFIEVEEIYGLNLKGAVKRGEVPAPSAFIVSLKRADGSIENVRFTKNITEKSNPGDTIELTVNRGIFRINYIVTE